MNKEERKRSTIVSENEQRRKKSNSNCQGQVEG